MEVEGTSQLTMVVRAILPDILFLQETHYTAGGEHKDYVEGMTTFHSSIPRGRTRSGKPVELPTHQRGRRAGLATALKNGLDPNRIATKLDETQALRGYLLPLRIETARGCILVLNTYRTCHQTTRTESSLWILSSHGYIIIESEENPY